MQEKPAFAGFSRVRCLQSQAVAGLKNRAALQRPDHERDDRQHQENDKQKLRDRCCRAGDAAETEGCRYQRQDEKDKGPTKHDPLLRFKIARVTNAASALQFQHAEAVMPGRLTPLPCAVFERVVRDDGTPRHHATLRSVGGKNGRQDPGETHMKITFAAIAFILATAATACNTVEGAGKDVQAAGTAVEETAKDVAN